MAVVGRVELGRRLREFLGRPPRICPRRPAFGPHPLHGTDGADRHFHGASPRRARRQPIHADLLGAGEGDNQLFVNFEDGATGTLRQKIADQWKEYTLAGQPVAGKPQFTVYFYSTGAGTIWLDDVSLVPVGGTLEE